MVEINPLVVTPDGRSSRSMRNSASMTTRSTVRRRSTPCATWPRRTAAKSPRANSDLNYIGLDGNIACLVNGAGLAMATMDIIQHHGGEPANFLDVGGGARAEQVTAAFKIILSDPT